MGQFSSWSGRSSSLLDSSPPPRHVCPPRCVSRRGRSSDRIFQRPVRAQPHRFPIAHPTACLNSCSHGTPNKEIHAGSFVFSPTAWAEMKCCRCRRVESGPAIFAAVGRKSQNATQITAGTGLHFSRPPDNERTDSPLAQIPLEAAQRAGAVKEFGVHPPSLCGTLSLLKMTTVFWSIPVVFNFSISEPT